MESIKVFSPGSITNLSCGYDILGVCLQNRGDEITVKKTNKKEIIIKSNDEYNISKDINKNVAGIAAQALLKNIDITLETLHDMHPTQYCVFCPKF